MINIFHQGPSEWLLGATMVVFEEGMYDQQVFAWGPDLSGTEQGAGGVGGLIMFQDYNGGGPMVPLYDTNGNLTHLFDRDGNKQAEYHYGPFGEVRGQSRTHAAKNPFRFSTKFTDNETGLVYYGYRYYSPSLGRWISRDPIEESDGPNSVAFVRNGPVGAVDALGLWFYSPGFGSFNAEIKDHANGPHVRGVQFELFYTYGTPRDAICLGCASYDFVQIIKASYPNNASIIPWRWAIDASPGTPFYPYKTTITSGVSATDMPEWGLGGLGETHFEAEICVVCSGGGDKGAVYGCTSWEWSHTVEQKASGPHMLGLVTLVKRRISGTWNQGKGWGLALGGGNKFPPPWSRVGTGNQAEREMRLNPIATVAPSARMQRMVLNNPAYRRFFY